MHTFREKHSYFGIWNFLIFMNFFLKKYASNQKITLNIFYLKFRLQYDSFLLFDIVKF